VLITSIYTALGRGLRLYREQAGFRQDQVATAARRAGLLWVRATVAQIEAGRRQLDLGESTLLPFILSAAGIRKPDDTPVTLADLILDEPSGTGILLSGSNVQPRATVRDFLRGSSDLRYQRLLRASAAPPGRRKLTRSQLRAGRAFLLGRMAEEDRHAAMGEAEQKASLSLGLPALTIARAARRQWKRTLTEERDRRLGQVAATAPARQRQAIRGHITRQLLKELAPRLTRASQPKRGAR
jgi:hypothetical protein